MPRGNTYIIGFAAAVCVVCSLLLSVVSGSLRGRQEENRVLDRQKNVLFAAGWSKKEIKKLGREGVQKTYAESFDELVIDLQGNELKDVKQADLDPRELRLEQPGQKRLPIFRQKDPANPAVIKSYIYPIIGKGLWSTLYGYLAVQPDGKQIIGMAFYKHGETPGLGAEIDKEWFVSNFKGKDIYAGDEIVGVQVVKGKVADKVGVKAEHAVDGISGATLTGDGVTKLMKVVPRMYGPFFKKVAGQKTALLTPEAGGQR
jgi:Na+-transporting NADH:ubiquinone oxidoreductase subunit C